MNFVSQLNFVKCNLFFFNEPVFIAQLQKI